MQMTKGMVDPVTEIIKDPTKLRCSRCYARFTEGNISWKLKGNDWVHICNCSKFYSPSRPLFTNTGNYSKVIPRNLKRRCCG